LIDLLIIEAIIFYIIEVTETGKKPASKQTAVYWIGVLANLKLVPKKVCV
jgi:hypothetical protein